MIRGVLTIFTFISVILFPWQFSALLAIASSIYVPLLPVSAGIFADTLYYTSQTSFLPIYSIFGAIFSGIAIFVRNRLSASIIK